MYKRFLSALLTVLFLYILFPVNASAEEEVNLAKNVSCIVEIGEPVSFSYGLLTDGDEPFEVNNGRLTDENVASTDADSNAWYRAYRGGSRIVRFDFQDQVAVSGVSAGFLFDSSLNICPPRYIKVFLSDDGVNYGLAAEFNTVYPLPYISPEHCDIRLDFEKTFSARYVNIEFSCDNYVYCDEISIFGTESLSGNEEKVEIIDNKEEPGFPADIAGTRDIIRLRAGEFSESEAKSYIGYLDTNGNISGRMFDAVCLAPSTDIISFSDISGWNAYFSDIVTSTSVIQSVAEEVYSSIAFEGELKLFVVLPYPSISDSFGDINGDGVIESSDSLEKRMDVLRWFIDRCNLYFSENIHEKVRLCGFFWGANEIDFNASSHEALLIQNTNAYIKDCGQSSVYEADYLAAGYDIWKELGFDCSVMHTGIIDNGYFDIKMLSEFSQSVMNQNSGVFIEFDNISYFLGDDFKKPGTRYESHLYYGYKNGYMNSITVFCGCENIFDYLCNTDINTPKGIYLRRLYDLTYNFIHRTYENLAPQLELQDSYELHSGDSGITIDISIIDGDSYWNDILVEFPVMPSHGNVVASANKKELIYNVEEGFVGEDSFTVRVTDGFGYSEEKAVSILVKDPIIIEPPLDNSTDSEISLPENSHISDSSEDKEPEKENNYVVPVICVLAVMAAIGIVVGIGILAKKRKEI